MTLSLTSFVRPFVMKELFFSLRSYKVVSRKSNGCFNEVSRMFHAIFMDRKFQGCLKKVSRVLQGCFEGVLREFQGCFKEVPRMIQGSFRAVLMKFPPPPALSGLMTINPKILNSGCVFSDK